MIHPKSFNLKNVQLVSCIFIFALFLAWSAYAHAQAGITILKINTQKAPDYNVVFSLSSAEGTAYKKLKINEVQMLVDGKETELEGSHELDKLENSEYTVGVVFIFPNAKAYREEIYNIRTNVANFLKKMGQKREMDLAGIVYYDSKTQKIDPVSGQDIAGLGTKIKRLKPSKDTEPDFYSSLPIAIDMLSNMEEADIKYLIVISDAEGKLTNSMPEEAQQKLEKAAGDMKDTNIIPIVIAYDPVKGDFLDNLQPLSQVKGGRFIKIKEVGDLGGTMVEVYDNIYHSFVYSFNIAGIEEGEHKFTVKTKIYNKNVEDSAQQTVPDNHDFWAILKWIGIIMGALLVLALIIFQIAFFAKYRKPGTEQHPVGPTVKPTDVGGQGEQIRPEDIEEPFPCPQCGKKLPFGTPSCPRCSSGKNSGKLKFLDGPLEGFTCYINELEITIGSDVRNSICIPDQSVSGKHAHLRVEENTKYELRDVQSTNGTFVDGHKITRRYLKNGDLIKFGNSEAQFKIK